MSQLNYLELGTDWVCFEDLATVQEDIYYYIQNRGTNAFLACESDGTPTTNAGVVVDSHKICVYKVSKGSNEKLYFKSLMGSTYINISSDNMPSEENEQENNEEEVQDD